MGKVRPAEQKRADRQKGIVLWRVMRKVLGLHLRVLLDSHTGIDGTQTPDTRRRQKRRHFRSSMESNS